MTIYITERRYTSDAIQGMLAKPEDRATAVASLTPASLLFEKLPDSGPELPLFCAARAPHKLEA